MSELRTRREFWFFTGCICVGAAAAAALAPWDRLFFPNFFFGWAPQLLVLFVAGALRVRLLVLGAVALALTAYLLGFSAWLLTVYPRERGMAWLFYMFSMPGALVGVAAALALQRLRPKSRPVVLSVAAFVMVLSCLIGLQQVVMGRCCA